MAPTSQPWNLGSEEFAEKATKRLVLQCLQAVTIHCDASGKCLGAALLQEDQPVAYMSRALTSTKQNYAQIEKEMLVIVFQADRFDQYVYGKPKDVHSDHKPLQTIFRKPLHTAPEKLQCYDFM